MAGALGLVLAYGAFRTAERIAKVQVQRTELVDQW